MGNDCNHIEKEHHIHIEEEQCIHCIHIEEDHNRDDDNGVHDDRIDDKVHYDRIDYGMGDKFDDEENLKKHHDDVPLTNLV